MPDYTGQTTPYGHKDFPLLSEIVLDLYQGVRPDTYIGYDLVVNCEKWLTAKPRKGYTGQLIHIPLEDEDDHPIPTHDIHAAAARIHTTLNQGGTTLVHCTGGLNRSSIVTATYLIRHRGFTPQQAVDQLRRARDPYCLCNKGFHTWIMELR